MPSIKDEILLLIREGIICFLNPRLIFHVGLPYNPSSFYGTIRRLEKDGLVEKAKKDNKTFIRLSQKGEKIINQRLNRSAPINTPWDRKWRLVVFDIPEEEREPRRYLRDYLKTLGFARVQRSVWISPLNFDKQIKLFAEKFRISRCVFLLTVESFRDLSGKEVASLFWDLPGLNNLYLSFIDLYEKKLRELEKTIPSSPEIKSNLLKRFLLNLCWDYNDIRKRHLSLPTELLPEEWAGRRAQDFINRCQPGYGH